MKEHPILFTGEMVRRIIAGEKTVTRRVIKTQPSRDTKHASLCTLMDTTDRSKRKHIGKFHWARYHPTEHRFSWNDEKFFRCPYGSPGDGLWVRETFQNGWPNPEENQHDEDGNELPQHVWYRSDPMVSTMESPNTWLYKSNRGGKITGWTDDDGWTLGKMVWKPSIHMPRWASRINLLVKSVKVERVQQIDVEGIKAEGVTFPPPFTGLDMSGEPIESETAHWDPWDFFKELWDGINAARGYSWESNPWVWVVEFEREA